LKNRGGVDGLMEPGFVEFVELEMPLKFRQEFCYNFAFPYFFLPQMIRVWGRKVSNFWRYSTPVLIKSSSNFHFASVKKE